MSAASRLRFASWLPSFALTRLPFALSLSKRFDKLSANGV